MSIKAWKESPATYFLLGLTTLVFIAQYLLFGFRATAPANLFQIGAMYGAYVQYDPTHLWRLISPIFVHIGLEHFAFNMITLYFMGKMAEQLFGTVRFLILYLLAGIMGNAFTLLFTPDVIAAGASTSLFGLFAAVVVLGYFSHNGFLNQLGRSYLILIGLNLLFNLLTPGIGITGHIGGLVGGSLVAVFLPNQVEPHLFKRSWRSLALAAYLALMAMVIAITIF